MSDASASVKPDRFKRLLKTLNQSELEMTSYELADLCWLLLHLPQIVETAENKTEGEIKDISSQSNSSSSAISVGNDVNKKNNEEAAGLFPRRPEQDSFVGGSGSLTFPVDNPSDLGSSLSLARALKTLLRRVPTQDRPSILDEVRTVESFAAADQKILAPVFKPTLEPWLELALVFDRGSSMDIWHQTLTDLKNALQHYGIFSNVQVWQLILTENNLTLHRELAKANSRVYHPKELLNPNGRRLIVVVSDCVASYWQDGKMFPLLKLWGQSSPLAILQMLPEWLWLKTGLGLGAKVTLFSDEPGLTNSRLKIRDVLLWENVIREQNRLQIPVFTLEPLSVERWSGVVVGRSDTKVAGFVLTPDTKEELEPDTELNLTPEEIVRRFRNNASLLAQELAELLAATPTIFLPVVRLIRKEMLPEAGQVQIAEVFLGGILRVRSLGIKESDPDAVLYDFINPEVRDILQLSSTRSTTVNVFDRVSKYIAKQLNLELRDFLAELKKPSTEIGGDIQGVIRPFAEVSARILRNLGGNYLAIAEQLEQAKDGKMELVPTKVMEFDVFLCHNSQDKPEVKEIAETLKQQGLTPWLDEWQLQPGLPWQRELEKQIQNIKSAAVFVGGSGIGPWQQRSIEAYLRRFVKQGCPVIPVLLPNAPNQPDLPLFLEGMTWVDFRRLSPKPMERLIWGITGINPRSPLELTPENSKTLNKEEAIKQIFPVQSQTFTFETFTVNHNGKASQPESRTARYYSEDLGNGITLEMVAIPGGPFTMGTKDEEIERLVKKFNWEGFRTERPQHQVTVPPFFMGKYPITQAQWKAIAATAKIDIDLETNPSNFKGDELPVENVNWYQATEFCKRLSRETKQEYRLPSEAEWEYACRAGTTTPFYFGETITGKFANYRASETYAEEAKGEYQEETTPVGQFRPNAFGLYDMHGNVWEWCADTWHDNYDGAPTDGSVWIENGNDNRSPMRGGSWFNLPDYCRSAYRYYDFRRVYSYYAYGFRVVCGAGRTL